jgi:PAS domain S-box-containing protein
MANNSADEMLNLWKKMRMINPNEVDDVRDIIKQSWLRSIEYGVNPYLKTNEHILTPAELQKKKLINEELLSNAEPVMHILHEFVKGTGFVIVLADREGYLLSVIGDEEGMEFICRVNFVEGTKWSEDLMGTNAVSLALYLNEAVQVYGYEHFCNCAYNSTCSATTIHDPEGEIIGVLDLTGPYEKAHFHTLGMVVAGVKFIETRIILQRTLKESHLANLYKAAIMESMSEGILTTDDLGNITYINQPAANILKLIPDKVIGKNLAMVFETDLEENSYFINLVKARKKVLDVPVMITSENNKIKLNMSCYSLTNYDGNICGKVIILQEVKRINRLINKIIGSQAKITFADLLGQSDVFQNCLRIARAAATSDSNVLLLGESGTGKDLIAQAIHNASIRHSQPFIAINCGSIPRDLIASELFGYDEGAFTGAKRGGNPGKFELADQGTIFLDEIGEMPLDLQTSLLRVIEEQKIMRVGGKEYIPVNIRIIAATNKDLAEEVKKGNFRQDLFYRLCVMLIIIPPLRKREEDIPLLANHFLANVSDRLGKEVSGFYPEVMQLFFNHTWPGNIRELQNVIERSVNLATGSIITPELILIPMSEDNQACRDRISIEDNNSLKKTEEEIIRNCLTKYKNKKKVAKQLGISRSTLYRKLSKYGMSLEEPVD